MTKLEHLEAVLAIANMAIFYRVLILRSPESTPPAEDVLDYEELSAFQMYLVQLMEYFHQTYVVTGLEEFSDLQTTGDEYQPRTVDVFRLAMIQFGHALVQYAVRSDHLLRTETSAHTVQRNIKHLEPKRILKAVNDCMQEFWPGSHAKVAKLPTVEDASEPWQFLNLDGVEVSRHAGGALPFPLKEFIGE